MDKINSSGIGDEIFKLWDEGFSGDKIAVMTGGVVSGRSIIRFLNRNGISTDYTRRAVKCHQCGVEFEKARHCFRKSRLHFCSMPCYWKHLKNPEYIRSVYGSRMARKVIRECGHMISAEQVVHHIDSNANNNDPNNLMVFADQGDHIRWHRNGGSDSGVTPVWPKSATNDELQEANERLLQIRKERKTENAAIFFNPQPKASAKGKK